MRGDFHMHTYYSYDCMTSPEALVRRCNDVGLDCIAVTDHNSLAGAKAVSAIATFTVILGEEVKSTAGEITGLFLTEEVPAGLSPVEMFERWRTLSIRDFVSFLPMENYLKTYDRLALGDGDGIKDKVFPHLGLDVEKINAAKGIEATFNVFNYCHKINEVITHDKIDVDLILAGMSLPMVLPPIQKADALYLDSAFVRYANLMMKPVRRGADELWVVWVLGNTDEYRGGMLNLYVHIL